MDESNWLCYEEKNLTTLSSMRLAAALWDSPTIKEEIKIFSMNLNEASGTIELPITTTRWWEITEKIITHIEILNLPHALLFELKRLIIFMGQKIFYWVVNVLTHVFQKDMIFDVKCFDKIFWTSDGLVDELKILQYWREEYPNFPGFINNYRNKIALYYLACFYWDEQYIKGGLDEIRDVINFCYGKTNVNSELNAMLIVCQCQASQVWRNTSELPEISLLQIVDGHYLDILYFSRAYIIFENEGVMKYFYRKSAEQRKDGFLFKNAFNLLHVEKENYHKRAKTLLSSMKLAAFDKLIQIFLLDLNISGVFDIFLSTWPYQNLCNSLLDHFWNFWSPSHLTEILDSTLKSITRIPSEYKETYNVVQLRVLKNVLNRIPLDKKLKFFTNQLNIKMYTLFKKSDYASINVIINDIDLVGHKYQLLDITKQMPHYFQKMGRLENLKEYAQKYFSPDEQEKFFSNDLLARLICGDVFDAADEIIKWRNISDEKRKNIHTESFFLTLFMRENRFILIDKYFLWQCGGNPEKAGNLKSEFFSTDFMCRVFWHVWVKYWRKNIVSTVDKCTNLLKYFFKTDEEIIWFKKHIIFENFAKTLCDVLVKLQNKRYLQPRTLSYLDYNTACWPDLDQIFVFCSISEDEVKEMKQKIKDDFDSYYFSYSSNLNEILVLNALVNWLCDTDEEKEHLVKKYLDPDATAKFLYSKFFKSGNEVEFFLAAGKIVFLRDWVSRYGAVNEIKERVKSIENIEEKDVLTIMGMLDTLPHNYEQNFVFENLLL